MASIGELNETGLHEDLKRLYADGARTEVEIDGYVVDVLRDDEIIEIQTRHLAKLEAKLRHLARTRRVRLVHPVAASTVIVKIGTSGEVISTRRSPRRGRLEDAFREITTIAPILPRRNITVEVVLVEVVEERRDDGAGSWRRKGVSITGRRLERVVTSHRFRTGADYLSMLPAGLPDPFTNADVGALAGLPYRQVQPLTSSLRKMGLIEITGRRGSEILYRRAMRRRPAKQRTTKPSRRTSS